MLAIGIALVILFVLLKPILGPFVFAAIVAYILRPLVTKLVAWGLNRTVAVVVVMSLACAIMLWVIMLLLPLFYQQISSLIERVPAMARWLELSLAPQLSAWLGMDISFDAEQMREWVSGNLDRVKQVALMLLPSVQAGTRSAVMMATNLAIVPLVIFYFLRDWDVIRTEVDNLLPRRMVDFLRKLMGEIDQVLGEFLRGQMLVMALMALYYSVLLKFVGLEYAVSVGVLTGLMVFIPYVGVMIGLSLAALAAVLQFDSMHITQILLVFGVFGLGQMLEGFVMTPLLVGERIGLHPVAVIFSLMAFGQMLGFVGVLLALPLAASILVTLRYVRRWYLASPTYQG